MQMWREDARVRPGVSLFPTWDMKCVTVESRLKSLSRFHIPITFSFRVKWATVDARGRPVAINAKREIFRVDASQYIIGPSHDATSLIHQTRQVSRLLHMHIGSATVMRLNGGTLITLYPFTICISSGESYSLDASRHGESSQSSYVQPVNMREH